MSDKRSPLRDILKKEAALFLGLLFCGLVLVPLGVWLVGGAVFGPYGGEGYADFFATLGTKIRMGDRVAWFLVLSPWLAWQCARLVAFGWRVAAKT